MNLYQITVRLCLFLSLYFLMTENTLSNETNLGDLTINSRESIQSELDFKWERGKTYNQMIRMCLDKERFELIDVEVKRQNGRFVFDYILQENKHENVGQDRCNVVINFSKNRLRSYMSRNNLEMIDLETLKINGEHKVFALLRKKTTSIKNIFKINFSKNEVLNFIRENPDLRIIDIETIIEDGKVKYSFVAKSNPNQIGWKVHLQKSIEELNNSLEMSYHRPIDIEYLNRSDKISAISIERNNVEYSYLSDVFETKVVQHAKTRDMRIIDIEKRENNRFAIVLANNIVDRKHPLHPKVKQEISRLVDEGGVVGVTVAIIKNGEIVYSGGIGKSDKRNNYGMSPYFTTQRWASLSKSTGGVIAAIFNEMGIIDINNDRISHYVDHPIYNSVSGTANDPTFIQLLSHQAGIPHYGGRVANSPMFKINMVPPAMLLYHEDNSSMGWAIDYWLDQLLLPPPVGIYKYSSFGPNLACKGLSSAYFDYFGVGKKFSKIFDEYVTRNINAPTIKPDYFFVNDKYKSVAYKKMAEWIERESLMLAINYVEAALNQRLEIMLNI